MTPVYSIVIPIYNEEAAIPILLRRLDALLDQLVDCEAILVDDGSYDAGSIVCEAKARSDRRYRYLRLSRNFGHQVAITAGMDAARGEAVVVMDADLQDPPEVVHEMIARWKAGYEVVYAERRSRTGESHFKRASAHLFYRLLDRLSPVAIPRNVGDFRLVDRKVVDSFRTMPERDRFVRGMFAWLGFKQTTVQFDRPPRVAGETKYPLSKMARLAVNGLVSFSDAPLRLALWMGMGVSTIAMLYGAFVIAMWVANTDLVPGWSSIIVIVAFLGGVNMMMTGIMGLYIGRIHAEVKRRPLYVVDRAVNLEAEPAALAASPSKMTFARQ
jgi:glycosyltransferase involved in cell wall biosynthesis